MKNLRFSLVLLLAICADGIGLAATPEAPPSKQATDIPYNSLEEATAALRAKKGVTFKSQSGWTVAEDLDVSTSWLLTPVGHPAYPSIVRRTLVNGPDGAYMDTNIRCFASKETCDKFFGGK